MRVAGIVCIASLTFTSGAARAQPDRINSITTPPETALTEFWTEQRLQSAQPIPLPVIERSTIGSDSRVEAPSAALPSGPSALVPGEVARLSGDVRTQPLHWAGKLFSVIDENTTGTCSAQVVAPNVVVTAAHCVRDDKTGEWRKRTIYRHQYERGKGRIFTTECIASYSGWVSSNQNRYQWDYAMIKLRGSLSEEQGYMGLEYNWQGKYNRVPKIGYPGQIENGEVIQVDFGQVVKGWAPFVVGLRHGNPNSTGGSSGGAWIGAYDPNANNSRANVVITVSSHYLNDEPRTTYGPYWDQRMVQLLNNAKQGCRS